MNFNLALYWRLLLRRLPAMMALFLLCTVIGVVMAQRMPTIYTTSARLLVEDPQIPDDMAASTVQTVATEQIEITRQQVMTRANLLDIARKLQVFPNVRTMSPDAIVAQMQAATRITSTGGVVSRKTGPQPTLVTVTFSAQNAQVAADVVNEYVTRIINANVEQRTGRAEGTLDFFKQEVDRLSGELDRSSAKISEFQNAHRDALPDDLSFRQSRQAALQERVASISRERSALVDQRARTVEVFKSTGQISSAEAALTPEQKQMQELEGQLANARSIYAETSPQVTMLKARLEQMAARIAPEAAADAAAGNSSNTLLDVQLAQIDSQISALDTQLRDTERDLETLGASIAATPGNTIVLQGLQRDYDNVRGQYDHAVQRLAQASMGERIELTSRGQRISLIEGANVPTSPSSPNRPQIVALGAGAGMALAGGLFLLLELLNRSVRIPAEITRGLGIVPLVTIPYIESRARKLFRRSLRVASLIIVVIGVPAVLWAVDTYYLPLDLLAERLMSRLGLT